MNGITSRCISFAQGNKDSLQRVNYEFGLVLGVDEFVDEQCYFLEKEYQHNRALHGYGTVSGLLVSTAERGDDIEVQVDPGMGIDQYGRVFIVRNTQCASLLSWLEEEGVDAGEQSIYVVARYAECENALVPIAGQPCSSSEQLTAPSRLKDIFEIELTLEPPAHPARDAVVNLAEFLSRFRADPAAPDRSDLGVSNRLAAIIGPDFITRAPAAFITHINGVVETETGAAGATLITVQPQIVESLLNDIFTYWLTAVRPTLQLDLLDPDSPETADAEPPAADILLAQIDLTFPDDGLLTLENITVDNSTRPYLLHTQLIQELFDIPDLAGEGGAAPPQQDVQTFATVEDLSLRQLNLWIHLDENLDLQPNENIHLFRVLRSVRTDADTGAIEQLTIELSEEADRRNEAGRYYRIRTFVNLNNNDFLLLRFDTDLIPVGEDQARTLTDLITAAPYTYENYNPRQANIHAHHIVERSDALSEDQIRQLILELLPQAEPARPTTPFVTITPITVRVDNTGPEVLQYYELWFHLDGIAEQNEGGIENLNQENLALYAEPAPGAIQELQYEINNIRPNLWAVFPQFGRAPFPLLRFVFSMEIPMGIIAFNPRSGGLEQYENLIQYSEETGQQLQGQRAESERFGPALIVYAREQGSAREVRE